jgi:hypothetical protein
MATAMASAICPVSPNGSTSCAGSASMQSGSPPSTPRPTQLVEPFGETGQIADAIAVAIGETAGPDGVDDAFLPGTETERHDARLGKAMIPV